MTTRRYCLISPCRNEAEYARRTLETVTAQTVPPSLWVIVDDGSTDETPQVLEEFARRFEYIRVIRRDNRGFRSVGPGVIEAFNHGLETVDLDDFDYLCKLDLDLELPRRYFEILMERMEANPRIGTCSGKPYFRHPRSQALVRETCGDEVSVGMTKFYRTETFRQIGGFVSEVMWDGIDCHRCRMLGWIASSWDESELRFVHLRPMGSSSKGILTGRFRHGSGQRFMGTGPVYLAASVLYRMAHRPVIVGALAIGWGYVWSALTRKPRYADHEFRRFLRRYQRDCLLLGKDRATRRFDEGQSASWRPASGPASGA
jgi:glycosyltransferase involved in cell wall biosynthesis